MTKIYADPEWEFTVLSARAPEFYEAIKDFKKYHEISFIEVKMEGRGLTGVYIDAVIARRPITQRRSS